LHRRDTPAIIELAQDIDALVKVGGRALEVALILCDQSVSES
jgi:hypothetical protein